MTVAVHSAQVPDEGAIDEPALVGRVQEGDTEAYALLVRRHLPRGLRIAMRVLRHREDAEDAVQDAFLRALERIDQCGPGLPFGPWFFRIVATTAINKQRSTRRRAAEELSDREVSTRPDPVAVTALGALQSDVTRAMATLPEVQRQLMALVTFEEFTPTEAAAVLEIPPGTARWHLFQARKALRTQLQAWLDDGGEDV